VPQLIYSATCSLDGFMAGTNGDMSWLTEYIGEGDPHVQRLLDGTGALLVGRRTYDGDDPNRGTDSEGAFGGQHDGPVVVLTHRPPRHAPSGVSFVSDLVEAVAATKDAAGKSTYVNVLGADVGTQCLRLGLLDEVLVFFVPVLLGDETHMFAPSVDGRIRLEPVADEPVHWYHVQR
jgi:dihydrofolate reductase